MPNVSIPESFPKSTFSKGDVEAEQKLRLSISGCVASLITESGETWIITSTYESADTTGAAPSPGTVVSAAPVAVTAEPQPPQLTLQAGLRAAIRINEIGDASPYQLSFAGKGKSGASFGFMQGDMAAGQPLVHTAFRAALAAANISANKITGLEQRLSVPLIDDPLTPEDKALVNAALNAAPGRAQIDAMDTNIFEDVCRQLNRCVATAKASGRQIATKAQIYMLLWINMSGPPTTLLTWLSGNAITMAKPVPRPGPVVDGNAMEIYLAATPFYSENPGNLPHILHSAAAGMNAVTLA